MVLFTVNTEISSHWMHCASSRNNHPTRNKAFTGLLSTGFKYQTLIFISWCMLWFMMYSNLFGTVLLYGYDYNVCVQLHAVYWWWYWFVYIGVVIGIDVNKTIPQIYFTNHGHRKALCNGIFVNILIQPAVWNYGKYRVKPTQLSIVISTQCVCHCFGFKEAIIHSLYKAVRPHIPMLVTAR